MQNFSNRLKALRKQHNLTQNILAQNLKITDRAYRSYEINKSTPNLENLIALADYFDVSIDYLVGRSDEPKRR